MSYASSTHVPSAAENASRNIRNRIVKLHALDTDNLTADQYNFLFKQISFWDLIDAEDILVFQTDTVLCENSSKKIESFLKFPYIGCPFDSTTVGLHKQWGGYPFYGIGGLSFRKKSFMMKCIRAHPNIEDNYAEDILFSKCVYDSNNTVSIKALNNFCTQHVYTKKSFGAHKITDLQPESREKFLEFCPAAKVLT